MNEDIKALVDHRLQQARETLGAARELLDSGLCESRMAGMLAGMKTKIIQFGLGPIGVECVKLAATKPWAEMVGGVGFENVSGCCRPA